MKKDLVEEVGRSSAIGRPILYGTTNSFLRYFDLESLRDLPEIDDIEDAIHEPAQENADEAEQITFLQ
jgi:segregation and condensation protein B